MSFIFIFLKHFFIKKKYITILIPQKKFGQSGGAIRWRVCYQRGLPRLVFFLSTAFRFNLTGSEQVVHFNLVLLFSVTAE